MKKYPEKGCWFDSGDMKCLFSIKANSLNFFDEYNIVSLTLKTLRRYEFISIKS